MRKISKSNYSTLFNTKLNYMRLLLLIGFIALFGCSTDQPQEQEKTVWTYVCQQSNPFVKKNSQGQYYIGATQVTKQEAEQACKLGEEQ